MADGQRDPLAINFAVVNQRKGPLSWRTRICYGVGHVLNDLCASMWFTYLLVYLHKVVKFSNASAGTLLLIGQVADAMCTPFVGIESDRTGRFKYGRRKIWNLVGVTSVALSFPFVFNPCLGCENSEQWAKFLYYTPFIVIFQFGWAASQISHLSLIPELTEDDNEKCGLNAIRYAVTGSCNIFVFIVTWVLLDTSESSTSSDKLGSADASAFMYVVFIVVGTGVFFSIVFHVGVKEHLRDCSAEFATKSSKRSAGNWTAWFREPLFYQIGMLYMCVRLIINVTQCYIPMYTLETLGLSKRAIAIMPLVVYVSGLVSTFFTKWLNKSLGRKAVFLSGLIIILGTSVWLWLIPPHSIQMFGASVTLGVGGSTLLVTVLTMLADLIGDNVETGAFVYGAMSFLDKMSNGIAIQIIQVFYPKNKENRSSAGALYYREVMVLASGATAILALLTLATLVKKNLDVSRAEARGAAAAANTRLESGSWSLICSKGPFVPCEPSIYLAQGTRTSSQAQESIPLYGSMDLT